MQYISLKAVNYINNTSNNDILSKSLSESYFYDNVRFDANTNDRDKQVHRKFQSSIQGSLITVVAPDLSQYPFKNIFFEKEFEEQEKYIKNSNHPNALENQKSWNKIKEFFNSSNDDIEWIQYGDLSFNKTAYESYFKMLFKNIAYAADLEKKTIVSIPGLGLGRFVGEMIQYTQQLSEMQFNILKEVAKSYPDITFKYFGLSNHIYSKDSNVKGIVYNDKTQNMVNEHDKDFMRVVAAGYNYGAGEGGGDNGNIGKDTNILEICKKLHSVAPRRIVPYSERSLGSAVQRQRELEAQRQREQLEAVGSPVKTTIQYKYYEHKEEQPPILLRNEEQNFMAKLIKTCVKFFVDFYDFCKNLLSAITNYISSKMGWRNNVNQQAIEQSNHK